MVTPASFADQMRSFFGMQPGQTISGFMAELKALDTADRAYFTDLLNAAGYPVLEKPAAA